MRRWAFFESDSDLSPVARRIMAEDIAGLDTSLGRDWQLNQPFAFCGDYCSDLAINLAIVENKQRVMDYLIKKGADLNVKGSPAITFAVRNSNIPTIQTLLDAGARIDAEDNVGSNAYSCALYSDRFDLLPFLLAKGLRVDADHGRSLRQAVSEGQRAAVEFFLTAGINPDLRCPNQVYPYNPTALQVAAENGDFEMVRLLIDHGANVTLQDDNGGRPFLAAAQSGNVAMQSYLRALEPAAWHDPDKKIALLKSHGVTQDLIEFLQQENRRVQIDSSHCTWLDFHELLNIHEMTWPGGPYISLLAGKDRACSCGALAWSKRNRKLVIINQEYDTVTILGSWAAFIADPSTQLAKQWS